MMNEKKDATFFRYSAIEYYCIQTSIKLTRLKKLYKDRVNVTCSHSLMQ